MQPLANKFIQLLESKQLLSDEVIDELRRQVAESKTKLSPELLAKLLVDNGHLTKFQATKLVAELAQETQLPTPTSGNNRPANEELGLAPASREAEVVIDDDEVEDVVEVEPVDTIENVVPVINTARVEAVEAVSIIEASPVIQGSRPVEAIDVESPLDLAPAPVRPVRTSKPKANPWDSFRILGIGTLFLLVCVIGGFLLIWFLRGSAEQAIKRADDLYQQRSYETAQTAYTDFHKNWPTDAKASYAKVRSALAGLRRDVEGGTSPGNALKTAELLLPPIAGEAAMSEQQADLTGSLFSLAEKFNTKMDQTKEISDRKALMGEMDRLMAIINDSKFVGSAQRTAQAPTLQKIEEARARILREIGRDDELAIALQEMDSLLDNKKILEAYEVRKQLINRYPLLEANDELSQRVRKASDIQRQLVVDATATPQFIKDTPADSVRTFIFANRVGREIGELEGTTAYFRVKGSIYALDAKNGNILWTKWVGLGLDSHPVRLSESNSADVLVTESESGKLHRVEGTSGQAQWSLSFGEPVLVPVVDNEEIFVSTHSGKLICLDAVGGQTKWAKQIPQPVNVSAAIAIGKQMIYQPGEHSNIYALERNSGTCKEVYYQGHRQGAFKVAPLWHKGMLFLFDNYTNDACKVRVLQPMEDGLQRVDNDRTVLEGNVINAPSIDRQQMLVQSDLGHSLILDVEPSAAKDKVTITTKIPKNFDSPHLTWSLFHNNMIWLADDRIARFDYLVTSSKLDRKWNKNDGDQFVGPLQLFGKTLIHLRRLKGNQGVRACAIDDNGEPIWQVDLGEPISLIAKKQNSGGFAMITSSGNYYSITNTPIATKADTVGGAGQPQKWFDNPLWLTPTQAIMLNRSNSKEFLHYSEGATPLRALMVPLGSAIPSCPAILAGDKIVVGLDSGQVAMFEPTTGALAGSPFQPQTKPDTKVSWNRPVFLPDTRAIVIANDQRQILRMDASQSLRQLSAETLTSPLVGPLALVGGQVIGVQAGQGSDDLVTFNPTNLAISAGSSLEEKPIAGPFSGEQLGLLQTKTKLVAFDSKGKTVWSLALPGSQIVGEPIWSDGKIILANRVGQLWVLDGVSGTVQGSVNLGRPLSTAPVELENRHLLIGSSEGFILVSPPPTSDALGGTN